MIRLFAAIAIPEDIGDGLIRRQQGLPGARWRPIDAFHITLRFVGEVKESVAEDLDAEFAALASPVTFRFYGWNAELSGGFFTIDNVLVTGSAQPTMGCTPASLVATQNSSAPKRPARSVRPTAGMPAAAAFQSESGVRR